MTSAFDPHADRHHHGPMVSELADRLARCRIAEDAISAAIAAWDGCVEMIETAEAILSPEELATLRERFAATREQAYSFSKRLTLRLAAERGRAK